MVAWQQRCVNIGFGSSMYTIISAATIHSSIWHKLEHVWRAKTRHVCPSSVSFLHMIPISDTQRGILNYAQPYLVCHNPTKHSSSYMCCGFAFPVVGSGIQFFHAELIIMIMASPSLLLVHLSTFSGHQVMGRCHLSGIPLQKGFFPLSQRDF
jgi:hypothetical protein